LPSKSYTRTSRKRSSRCFSPTCHPVNAEGDDIGRQAENQRPAQNIPLLDDLAWAELGIHPFPNDAGNENDDELKEEYVHGCESPTLQPAYHVGSENPINEAQLSGFCAGIENACESRRTGGLV
jgi:hypothetical protein